MPTDAHRAIEVIWRIESARLIAGLARLVGDIGTAEELAQDALVAALEQWPTSGVPERPGAWLMATAKHHATDLIRRRKTLERKYEELGRSVERDQRDEDFDTAIDEEFGDDLLGLVFMACHPVLSKDARIALTLRVLGGLTTEEIARAFLIPVSSIAQRIVRAKRTLTEAHVRFEVPGGPERVARLASVLEVIYLIFNEGYAATAGEDWVRPALCEEALRLGRILAGLVPTEPEVHGLVALMEIHASRLHARIGPSGQPVLLLDQDRARWDHLLVSRGLAALERAERLGGAMGPYALQAAIAACHARAATAAETDWPRMVALYDALAELAPSPVVELNRAVAVGMAFGPAAGLELVDGLVPEPSLTAYHLLSAVRGDLLRKLGRFEEARAEFERAASLTENVRERELLQRRAAEHRTPGTSRGFESRLPLSPRAYSPARYRGEGRQTGGIRVRAAVLHTPRTSFAVEDLVLDAPRANEVLVRIAAAGVCHSDWHFVTGDLQTPMPVVLGHEGAGVVEEVGPNVTSVKPGDHVVLLWRAGCGRCEYCSAGKPALCSAGRAMRSAGMLLDGTSRLHGSAGEVKHFLGVSCFAERAVVPEMSLLPIGVDVPLEIAALVGCAVMTGVGAVVNTAAVRPGASVLIIGAGGVGLSAVMGARLAGADPIIVLDLVSKKLELARELGATHVLDGRGDLVESVREVAGEGVDFAFECIGNSALLAQAVKALRRGGTAVAVGLPRADAAVSVNVVELVTQEKSLKGSIYGSTRHFADIPRLISLYSRGRLPIDRLLGRRYRLTEINDAYQALLNGEFARAVIVPN